MKKVLGALAFLIFNVSLFAQAPEGMSYQSVIRNSSDELVTNRNIGIQVSILQGSISGNPVFVERHFPTTNSNGLVSLEIGAGIVVSGNFAGIDWGGDRYFIKTETDLNGGANYSISGTSELLSVPYSLYSKKAETVIESDPYFNASLAKNITEQDTTHWGNDADATNEIQQLSLNGDTLSLTKTGGTVFLPEGVIGYSSPTSAGFGTTTSLDLATVTFKLNEPKTVLILADVNIWGTGTTGCEETIRLSIDGDPVNNSAVHVDIQEAVGGDNGASASTSWMTTLGAGMHTVKLRAWNQSCPFHKHAHLHVLVLGNKIMKGD